MRRRARGAGLMPGPVSVAPIPTLVLVVSADGRILEANDAAREVVDGATAGGAADAVTDALGPPGQELARRLREVLEGTREQAVVVGEVTVRGHGHTLQWNLQRMSGVDARAAVLVEDITSRVRAERERRESRVEADRLALVARHTDDAVFITGPDGVISWVNGAFVEATGFDAEDAVGHRRLDLVRGPFTRSEQFRALGEDLDALRRTSAEFITRTRAGSSYWVQLEVSPVVQDGEVVGLIGVERNVTERRAAQERGAQALRRAESLAVALQHEKRLLSTVLSTIPHVVWWKGTDLRYTGCNQAYLRLRGLGSEAELIGRLEEQLEGPATATDGVGAQLVALERDVLEGGEPVIDSKLSIGQPPRRYQVSVLPHVDNGSLAGVVGVGADITRATEMERQLAQANRLESIGQLAAGIAHEINTPVQYASDNTRFVAETVGEVLTALGELERLANGEGAPAEEMHQRLRTLVDGLDLEFVTAELPSALEQSLEGLDRVSQIVRAMKDFSHPGRGRASADLNRLVTSTVQVSRNEWKYVAELTVDLDPEAGLVSCFEGDIKQVVLNLIVNAAHAVDERRRQQGTEALGSITVATRRDGEEIRIMVSDDGTGMDEATQRRIFDPFFTTKAVGKGTGQGLSLAHTTVVKKHQGRLEVESAPGKGSTFAVVLPVKETSAAAEDGTGPDDAAGGAVPA